MTDLPKLPLLLRSGVSTASHPDRSLTGVTVAPDGGITILTAGIGLGVRLSAPELIGLALLLGETGTRLLREEDAAAQAASAALDRIFGEAAGHA